MSHKKRGKAIGYKILSNKTAVNENSKFNTSEPKGTTEKVHRKEKRKENV